MFSVRLIAAIAALALLPLAAAPRNASPQGLVTIRLGGVLTDDLSRCSTPCTKGSTRRPAWTCK